MDDDSDGDNELIEGEEGEDEENGEDWKEDGDDGFGVFDCWLGSGGRYHGRSLIGLIICGR